MKVIHGPQEAEMTTTERARRGNLMAGYLGISFAPSFTPHCFPYRPGMTKDKILITDIKIMV
jgi:hypothetical protein